MEGSIIWIGAGVVVLTLLVGWVLGAARTRSRYRAALHELGEALSHDRALPRIGNLPGVSAVRTALGQARERWMRVQQRRERTAVEDETEPEERTEAIGKERTEAGAARDDAPVRSEPASTGAAREPSPFVHRALDRMQGYLKEGVEHPLRESLTDDDRPARAGIQDALVALEDLYFYLRDVPEDRSTEDLNELAREAVSEYREESGTDVDVLVPERPTRVRVEREAFLDALYLVLHNADAFGGGTPIDVVVRYQDGDCWLVVRDEGEGFGEEALERAFEPFYGTSRLGLGLGLHHVKKIVGAMDGTVAVRNRPRGGGQVEIVLPEAPDS